MSDKPAPLHRQGDIVDVDNRVCRVVAVENCYPFENMVTVQVRGSHSTSRRHESDVSSPYNRELR